MDFNANSEGRIEELILQAVPPRRRPAKLARDMRLHHDLGIDSLGMVALVFRLEQAFAIDLSNLAQDIDVRRLRTVQDLIDMSRQILQQAGA
jgi:acyl carrier protein